MFTPEEQREQIRSLLLEAQQYSSLGLVIQARERFEAATSRALRLPPQMQQELQSDISGAREVLDAAGVVF